MANYNAPTGLSPVMYAWGSGYDGKCRPYIAPASYATALFIGDPVVMTGTSNTTALRNFPPGTLPEINKATAGSTNLTTGVIVGFLPLNGQVSVINGPASTDRIVLVADSPDILFAIQDDGVVGLTAAVVGSNANYIFTASGSAITGRSGVQLNSSTPAATQGFQIQIIGLLDRPDVELGAFGKWLVRINQHTFAPNQTSFA